VAEAVRVQTIMSTGIVVSVHNFGGIGASIRTAGELRSALRRVTYNTELVSLSISEVGAVVVWVVFRPDSWRTFGAAAAHERDAVSFIHDCATFGEKCHHLTVAYFVLLIVVRFAD